MAAALHIVFGDRLSLDVACAGSGDQQQRFFVCQVPVASSMGGGEAMWACQGGLMQPVYMYQSQRPSDIISICTLALAGMPELGCPGTQSTYYTLHDMHRMHDQPDTACATCGVGLQTSITTGPILEPCPCCCLPTLPDCV